MLKSARSLLVGAVVLGTGVAGAVAFSAHPEHDHGKAAAKGAVTCPVMNLPVRDPAKSPRLEVNNVNLPLCCAGCPDMLRKEPAKYLKHPLRDPVTKKPFRVTAKTPRVERPGALFLFGSAASKAAFERNPEKYVRPTR